MSSIRRIPVLGQPSRSIPLNRSEPQLPVAPMPIPARGPHLGVPADVQRGR
ncbi:hypothetical protein AAG565_10875 [Fontimonas sp. SYSU GA230001]|uniref:hypothetical protein n=1 Tax=Fontimonas sp. SYSU GA230001 TaxID=3142450 RepID=UPI0032B433C5